MAASFRLAVWVCCGHVVVVGGGVVEVVEGVEGRGSGSCRDPGIILRTCESPLAVEDHHPFCFLKSNRFTNT